MIITYLNPLHCADEHVTAWPSSRRLRACQKLWKAVVHTRYVEVRFALERSAQIVNLMRVAVNELDHAEDEIVGRVERIENLVSTDGESLLALTRGLSLR